MITMVAIQNTGMDTSTDSHHTEGVVGEAVLLGRAEQADGEWREYRLNSSVRMPSSSVTGSCRPMIEATDSYSGIGNPPDHL